MSTVDVGNFELKSYYDTDDPISVDLGIERKNLYYKDCKLLSANIYHKVDPSHHEKKDYAVYWSGRITCDTLLHIVNDIHRSIYERFGSNVEKSVKNYRSESDLYNLHILFPNASKHEKALALPFDMEYFSKLYGRDMQFIRIDMMYFDVWADLLSVSHSEADREGEIGLTSYFNIPNEIVRLFLKTTSSKPQDLYQEREQFGDLVSTILEDFQRI